MATAQTRDDKSVCSICYGDYKTPCVIPGCRHKFCEKCLLTYIRNLLPIDNELLEFQCPNCRETISLPQPIDGNLQTWIESLVSPIANTEMAVNIDIKGENVSSACGPCRNDDKSVVAEMHCLECQETLCASCSRIRHGTKLLDGHSIIDLQNASADMKEDERTMIMKKLLESVKCKKHPDKIVTLFCRDDDDLCCVDCVIENHRHCDTITNLNSEAIQSETAIKAYQIKELMKRIASQIELLKAYKKDNVADIKRKSEEVIERIGQIRTKLNNFLDAVEENIGSSAKAFVKERVIDANEETEKLNDISKVLKENASLIECTETLGYPSKLCIVLNKLMLELAGIEQKVLNTAKQFYSGTFEIELKIEPVLDELLNFGSNDANRVASVVKSGRKIHIPGFEVKQLQVEGRLEKITEHTVLPVESLCSYPHYYCIVHRRHKNGIFLISYECHYFFCSTDENYNPENCYNKSVFSGRPFSATTLKNDEIAVSVPESKNIFFLTANNAGGQMQLNGNINTKYTPKALHGLKNGNIAVSWNGPVAFGILDFKCNLYEAHFEVLVHFQTDTAGRKLKTFDFMAVDEKRGYVIQPCTEDKAVYCFDVEGNPKFKYTHEDLVFPRGVSISGDGNIFVCDEKKAAIHVTSPEGQGLYVLKEGCPQKPLAIAFDESGSQFAVSQNCEPWKIIRIFTLA